MLLEVVSLTIQMVRCIIISTILKRQLIFRRNLEYNWSISHVAGNKEGKFFVEDGCSTAGSNIEGSFQEKSYQAGVRCCSNDGKSCQTPMSCRKNTISFDDAVAKCREMGLRICTKAELLGGVCCGTGGNCDHYSVWTSTAESGMYAHII